MSRSEFDHWARHLYVVVSCTTGQYYHDIALATGQYRVWVYKPLVGYNLAKILHVHLESTFMHKSNHNCLQFVCVCMHGSTFTTPAICPEFVQKRIENVLFVNYPNKAWNRATFFNRISSSFCLKIICIVSRMYLKYVQLLLKKYQIVSGLDYHIFSLHLTLHCYT